MLLKGIITEEDWNTWKEDIVVDYVRDNHFTELKDQEILKERLQTMDMVQQYVGEYYSKEWVMKNVLMLSDEDIEEMKKDIDQEISDGEGEEEEVQPDQEAQINVPQGSNGAQQNGNGVQNGRN